MKLFLDDTRLPADVVGDIYMDSDWQIVGNYHEFITFVMEEGVPDVVSFDHDLADEHYDIDWWEVYMEGMLAPTKEPTGLECARWLHKFCGDTNTKLPIAMCHSMNPVGRQVIDEFIKSWSNEIK